MRGQGKSTKTALIQKKSRINAYTLQKKKLI